jgi:hypothetical protein
VAGRKPYHFVVEWFLLVLLVVLLVPVAVLTSAALVTAESLRRANRLMPGRTTATSPPLRWLWSPGAAAGLHRRLKSACHLVAGLARPLEPGGRWRRRRPAPPVDGIAQLARDVLEEAVILDRQVVSASYVARGVPRAQTMASLEYQVRAVEDAARRVHQLATRRALLARPPVPDALSLDQRIAAMEEALGELTPRPPAI